MARTRGGYTVIEVLIVIAVTSLLFISAVALFAGRRQATAFTQGMHDIDSKMHQYINQVGAGLFPEAGAYSCTTSATNRPVLSDVASSLGSNADCIFLGKAMQVSAGSDRLYTYTVLGNRTKQVGGEPVTTFSDARPEPAVNSSGFVPELVEEYRFVGGAKLKSVNASNIVYWGDAAETIKKTVASGLVGFYNSLQDSGSAGGAQSVFAKGYTDSTGLIVQSVGLRRCIEEQLTPCTEQPRILQWVLCFESDSSNRTAVLSLDSTPAGITSTLSFKAC